MLTCGAEVEKTLDSFPFSQAPTQEASLQGLPFMLRCCLKGAVTLHGPPEVGNPEL